MFRDPDRWKDVTLSDGHGGCCHGIGEDGRLNAGVQQGHGRGVPQHVRRDRLILARAGRRGAAGDQGSLDARSDLGDHLTDCQTAVSCQSAMTRALWKMRCSPANRTLT
jgi:hypothetical protein